MIAGRAFSGKCEVIIVDNSAQFILSDYLSKESLPFDVKVVHEPRKGKGFAYNTGVEISQGELVLFTDDDVQVPPNWVSLMVEAQRRNNLAAIQGGVRIAPHLERRWLKGMLRIWVAEVVHPSSPPHGLVGANMLIRRDAIDLCGGFSTELGPGLTGFFDDTLIWARLRAQGAKSVTFPRLQ